jgi:hypothetical protein
MASKHRERFVSFVRCAAVSLGLPGLSAWLPGHSRAADKPDLFQSPALSRELIPFGYAGDLVPQPARPAYPDYHR